MRGILVLLLAVTLAACGGASESPDQLAAPETIPVSQAFDHSVHDHAMHQHGSEAPVEEPVPLTGASIYQAAGNWMAQDGAGFQLSELKGSPVVVSMVYTACGHACPTLVRDMKKIADGLPEGVRDRVRYVLVSFDTQRDTPDVLMRYAEVHHLDPQQWTLLHGEDEDVRMLAALLGVRYKREASGMYSHSNVITILDQEGEVRHRQEGLGTDPAASIAALSEL